jgi:hypothetical protein
MKEVEKENKDKKVTIKDKVKRRKELKEKWEKMSTEVLDIDKEIEKVIPITSHLNKGNVNGRMVLRPGESKAFGEYLDIDCTADSIMKKKDALELAEYINELYEEEIEGGTV